MTGLTSETVLRVAGVEDDALVRDIIATRCSEAELRQACAWLANEEALVNDMRPFPKGRVGAVVDLLRRHEEVPVEHE